MVDFLHRISLRRWRLALRALVAGVVVAGSGAASAGFVTTFEDGMDSIFSQTSFGTRAIDIRFNPTQTVVAANLLSIDTDPEFDALTPLRAGLAANIVSVFFVDAITFCSGPGTSIIGCGSTPGNVIALKSSSASSSGIGAKLMAHELGHNLGLDHVAGANLMNGTISNSSSSLLNDDQVLNIFATKPMPGAPLRNDIIQGDATNGYFISITPFAVVAAIPEPHTWAMLVLGLLGLAAWVRRRPQRAVCLA